MSFNILDHRHYDTSFDTQSRKNLFNFVEYYIEKHLLFNTLSRQSIRNMSSDC